MTEGFLDVLGRLDLGLGISRQELALLLAAEADEASALHQAADEARARTVGDEVHLRALVEFSNYCRRNCCYCGLRRDHRALPRYRMSEQEILDSCAKAAALGYRTVVLQSGEDPSYTAARLASLLRRIKDQHDFAVTLSIGERDAECYRQLREAGADRFLLRIETSSPALYRALHPDSDWAARLERLHTLRRLGYQTGSGVMIGLPGQTIEMLADDLLFLQAQALDMIGVGPFLPNPATPLGGARGGSLALSLNFIACLRLLCPEALIPATTALGALAPNGQQLALQAGADVIMPNLTPRRYREHYQLYPGKADLVLDPADHRHWVEQMIVGLGRRVGAGLGHSRLGPRSWDRPLGQKVL